jgi:Transposase IS4
MLPKNTKKSQPISQRPGNPEGCAQIWIWWRCCSSLVKTNQVQVPGHKLNFDNYFANYQIFEVLKKFKINEPGTLRVNCFAHPPFLSDKETKNKGRGYPDEVKNPDGNVVLIKWQDNKSVFIGSNFVDKGQITVNRWDKAKKNVRACTTT